MISVCLLFHRTIHHIKNSFVVRPEGKCRDKRQFDGYNNRSLAGEENVLTKQVDIYVC